MMEKEKIIRLEKCFVRVERFNKDLEEKLVKDYKEYSEIKRTKLAEALAARATTTIVSDVDKKPRARPPQPPSSNVEGKDPSIDAQCEIFYANCFRDSAFLYPQGSPTRPVISRLLDLHRKECAKCDRDLRKQYPRVPALYTNQNQGKILASRLIQLERELRETKMTLKISEEARAITDLAYEERIKAYEAEILEFKRLVQTLLNKEINNNKDPESVLGSVEEPQLNEESKVYLSSNGFKLIGLSVLRSALLKAQRCNHGNLELLELLNRRVGLVSQLAFVCQTCQNETVFCTSGFSRKERPNFTINKALLSTLGQESYYRLGDFLSHAPVAEMSSFKGYTGEKDVKDKLVEKNSVSDSLKDTDTYINKTLSGEKNNEKVSDKDTLKDKSDDEVQLISVESKKRGKVNSEDVIIETSKDQSLECFDKKISKEESSKDNDVKGSVNKSDTRGLNECGKVCSKVSKGKTKSVEIFPKDTFELVNKSDSLDFKEINIKESKVQMILSFDNLEYQEWKLPKSGSHESKEGAVVNDKVKQTEKLDDEIEIICDDGKRSINKTLLVPEVEILDDDEETEKKSNLAVEILPPGTPLLDKLKRQYLRKNPGVNQIIFPELSNVRMPPPPLSAAQLPTFPLPLRPTNQLPISQQRTIIRPLPLPESVQNGLQSLILPTKPLINRVPVPASAPNNLVKRIKPTPDLPPGCRILSVAPGTKIMSSNVTNSTTEKTGLNPGVYRVFDDKNAQKVLIVKDNNVPGAPPVANVVSVMETRPVKQVVQQPQISTQANIKRVSAVATYSPPVGVPKHPHAYPAPNAISRSVLKPQPNKAIPFQISSPFSLQNGSSNPLVMTSSKISLASQDTDPLEDPLGNTDDIAPTFEDKDPLFTDKPFIKIVDDVIPTSNKRKRESQETISSESEGYDDDENDEDWSEWRPSSKTSFTRKKKVIKID